jgi:predicted transcriptional regulator
MSDVKRGPGRPPLPADQKPIMFAIRLRPDAATRLRELSKRYSQSYPTIIDAALKIMSDKIDAQDRLTD